MLQQEQDVEQAVTILPSRQTHHHFVAVFDHGVAGDGFSDQPAQPGLESFGFCGEFASLLQERWLPISGVWHLGGIVPSGDWQGEGLVYTCVARAARL